MIIVDTDAITLLNLAANAVVKEDSPLTLGEDYRMIKVEMAAHLLSLGAVDDLPINLYVTDNEMSEAEIAEAIVVGGPLDRNDRVAMERAERPVFLLGTFGSLGAVPAVDGDYPLLGPKGQQGIIEKVVRWTFSNPEGWAVAAFNASGGILTTGAVVQLQMKFFGVWVT